jgi:hypothetical protein
VSPARRARPAWTDLQARLRGIEQGDLISFGAIGIAVRPDSAFARSAGLAETDGPGVVALTVETASGWYAVLSQDCDIVRDPGDEPCLTIAPVMYVPEQAWTRLHQGQTSYKQFPLPVDQVAPVDAAHADRIPEGHRPVVDIRYVGTVDKTALAAGFEQRHPLPGKDKLAFQVWISQRFGRESFADLVHEKVLPAARGAIDAAISAQLAGESSARTRTVASISQYWVRATDRYAEVMGRLEPNRARAASVLRRAEGADHWNTTELAAGCKVLSKAANTAMRATGYTVKFTTADFDDLSASEFETYALWCVDDEPPST